LGGLGWAYPAIGQNESGKIRAGLLGVVQLVQLQGQIEVALNTPLNTPPATLRAYLAQEGRSPQISALQGQHWHDTPNVRFLSIADFEHFCAERGIRIHQRIALDTEADLEVREDPNLNADLAIMVISR